MFTGRKLPITLAFVALVALAIGASCKGFFVDPVLTSIAVDPTAPQVDVGKTQNLQVFGNYDDGTRKVVKSGVSWSTDAPDVATIDAKTGVLTGVSPGSAGIKASAQALEADATATVILTGVNLITVAPSSGTVNQGGEGFTFTFTATAGTTTLQLTTDNGGILTITPTTSDVTCAAQADNTELCTADSAATKQQYSIRMTYPGSSASATATLTVN
jgi:hypothetical protein